MKSFDSGLTGIKSLTDLLVRSGALFLKGTIYSSICNAANPWNLKAFYDLMNIGDHKTHAIILSQIYRAIEIHLQKLI